ncbi:hypothetical protein LA080_004799 [Diaporthe eres]|nr:hypothetical protein LA080_004799 [Diaporthe eres]
MPLSWKYQPSSQAEILLAHGATRWHMQGLQLAEVAVQWHIWPFTIFAIFCYGISWPNFRILFLAIGFSPSVTLLRPTCPTSTRLLLLRRPLFRTPPVTMPAPLPSKDRLAQEPLHGVNTHAGMNVMRRRNIV